MANRYHWYIISPYGDTVASFSTQEMACRCLRYYTSQCHVEYRP